jgi:mitogen-activated protein kinase organizer 1
MTGSEDRSVSLFNPSKNLMIKSYKNLHNYDISCLDISKDNSKFMTGGGDKVVLLMDVLKGQQIRKYTGHYGRINGLCYTQGENVIVIVIFSSGKLQLRHYSSLLGQSVECVHSNPDDK